MCEIYIVGAGNLAREVYEILRVSEKEHLVKGFVVNLETNKKSFLNLPVITFNKEHFNNGVKFINGIGSPKRKEFLDQIAESGFSFISVVHPSVVVGRAVDIEEGVVINAGTVMTTGIEIKKHCILNVNVVIHHDVLIGENVFIGSGTNIAGNVEIGENSWIGIGCNLIHNIKIGANCIIGSGSNVTKSIPDDCLVYGNPARIVRKVTQEDLINLL